MAWRWLNRTSSREMEMRPGFLAYGLHSTWLVRSPGSLQWKVSTFLIALSFGAWPTKLIHENGRAAALRDYSRHSWCSSFTALSDAITGRGRAVICPASSPLIYPLPWQLQTAGTNWLSQTAWIRRGATNCLCILRETRERCARWFYICDDNCVAPDVTSKHPLCSSDPILFDLFSHNRFAFVLFRHDPSDELWFHYPAK